MDQTSAASVDVLIAGAGPIGIETGIVLQSEGWDVLVVDAGAIGETIRRTFPPHTRFFTSPERLSIRGVPVVTGSQEKVTGEEYLAFLRSVVVAAELPVRTYTTVVDIRGVDGDFTAVVVDPAGRSAEIHARKIVLATGGTDNPRRLCVPGEDLPFVHSYLGDPHRFFQRRVAVVGGRNSAAESALRLYRAGASVVLIHRHEDLHERVKFWIRPEVESLMAEGLIIRVMPARVVSIEPGSVVVHLLDADVTEIVAVDDVLLQIGFEQDQTLFGIAGVTVNDDGQPRFKESTCESSDVPGVFVVGTATAGTQSGFTIFIENCHQHADRVAAFLAGRPAPQPVAARPIPES